MKNRWIILFAGVIIQIILGGVYAWSTFTPYLTKNYNLSKGQCGFIFGLTIAVFALAMVFAGRVIIKKGPRFTAGIGAILFIAGYIVSSFSNGNFVLLLLGLSVITGAGIGFGYICPLSVGMKWFPDKKGLVTGIAVAGFGGGAVLLSSVARYFLNTGIDVLEFFYWIGLINGTLLFIASLFLVNPPITDVVISEKFEESMIFTLPFGIMAVGLFSGTFSGLLIIGNLTPIIVKAGLSDIQAVRAISIFAVGNALGRILWGYVFDYFNYKSIPASLGASALFILFLLFPLKTWGLLLVSGLVGFGFGANFVIYAAAISRYFGCDNFSKLYPICFLGYGIAGLIAPGTGGWLADKFGSYEWALLLSIAIVSFSCILTSWGLSVFQNGRPLMKTT